MFIKNHNPANEPNIRVSLSSNLYKKTAYETGFPKQEREDLYPQIPQFTQYSNGNFLNMFQKNSSNARGRKLLPSKLNIQISK